ncbi:right-handed parallel beta-helix repeat-containing protein [Polyangium fumosum]|uniref:Right-handed parallel beta-helix repeat-containing protein n=1 Tax=Polyangium fumosum TaxID=889272 RepID=A0A4U1IS52_9BACT|nr:right-handed parallel beta-helix repeat-containing protein [Polyangium fumosum]TKC97149.1 right-handed parallel beta-helix repeat-containing protein [Polyangium fumosum]
MPSLKHARTSLALSACTALSLLILDPASASAADCGCNHEITPGTWSVNGTELGVKPGDVVCVMAGDYEYIRFREIRGTEEAPVVVKNCGGVVNVRNLDRAYSVDFQGSSHHFHLTGTGEAGVEYGFRVSAPDKEPYPGVGLWFLDKSTDYEVDHIEVYDTGFAGVMSKTDPLCDGSADQDKFIQKNVHLHHLWVHDTGGEGFYVGSTQGAGHTITCNGQQEVRMPHFLEGIEIDHCLVEDTGWDGAQVGMAHEGCSVHDNIIRRVGGEMVQYQWMGLQIGGPSKCDIRRNIISDGPVNGIFVFGANDTTVADNVVLRFGETNIYANIQNNPGPVSYRIAHNTLVGFGKAAVQVFGDKIEGAFAYNNLVVGPTSAIGAGNDVGWKAEGNLFVPTVAEAGFVAPDADDYHLTENSPARGAGIDHSADGFTADLDGYLRAKPPAVGAYEFVMDSPTGGVGGGSTSSSGPGAGGGGGAGASGSGAGASGGAGGASADDPGSESGCGCRVAGTTDPTGKVGGLFLVAGAFLATGMRRRRRAAR